MGEAFVLAGPLKDFENAKKIDRNGIEYWKARELMLRLGYEEWWNLEVVVKKAINAAIKSVQNPVNHFVEINKMVPLRSGALNRFRDYKVDRYACYPKRGPLNRNISYNRAYLDL